MRNVYELINISHWLSANKLSLTISRTKCMLFQNTQNQILNHEKIILHGNKIEKVDHFKFLGIWIDKKLNWEKNTYEKCKKLPSYKKQLIKSSHCYNRAY